MQNWSSTALRIELGAFEEKHPHLSPRLRPGQDQRPWRSEPPRRDQTAHATGPGPVGRPWGIREGARWTQPNSHFGICAPPPPAAAPTRRRQAFPRFPRRTGTCSPEAGSAAPAADAAAAILSVPCAASGRSHSLPRMTLGRSQLASRAKWRDFASSLLSSGPHARSCWPVAHNPGQHCLAR